MDWNANKCLANFCHAFKVLRGHPSINWQHAPFLVHRQPPVPQMSSLGLRFMEADRQAASSCSNPRLDVFLPCTSSDSCPWGPLTQWMLQAHHVRRSQRQELQVTSQVTHRMRHKPPVPLPSCLLASPLCAVPTQGVSAPCFLRNDGSHYVSICCERLTPRELIPLSYMQFTYISLPWQAQMSHQKRILSPFSMAIRRYGPHRHSEDQISKLITFSKGTISLN